MYCKVIAISSKICLHVFTSHNYYEDEVAMYLMSEYTTQIECIKCINTVVAKLYTSQKHKAPYTQTLAVHV